MIIDENNNSNIYDIKDKNIRFVEEVHLFIELIF
jgi:hypothetical protein